MPPRLRARRAPRRGARSNGDARSHAPARAVVRPPAPVSLVARRCRSSASASPRSAPHWGGGRGRGGVGRSQLPRALHGPRSVIPAGLVDADCDRERAGARKLPKLCPPSAPEGCPRRSGRALKLSEEVPNKSNRPGLGDRAHRLAKFGSTLTDFEQHRPADMVNISAPNKNKCWPMLGNTGHDLAHADRCWSYFGHTLA